MPAMRLFVVAVGGYSGYRANSYNIHIAGVQETINELIGFDT